MNEIIKRKKPVIKDIVTINMTETNYLRDIRDPEYINNLKHKNDEKR